MVVETLLPVAAVGTAGLAYGVKRKVFPPMPEPDEDHSVLPIKLKSGDAEDISNRFVRGIRIPCRSLLTLGASGAGKSEMLKHFVDQFQNEPNEPMVVYDHKTDYQEFLEEHGVDMIQLSSGGSADENRAPIAWNIFTEIEAEEDADELARGLFPDERDDFWTGAARQLFAATLKYIRREVTNPDNADLVGYWQRTTLEKMHEKLIEKLEAEPMNTGRHGVNTSATRSQRAMNTLNTSSSSPSTNSRLRSLRWKTSGYATKNA